MAAAGRRGREGGGKVGGLGANGSRCLPASRRALAAHAPRSNASAVAAAFEATKAEVGSGLPVPFPSLPPSLVTRGHLSSEDVRSKQGRKERPRVQSLRALLPRCCRSISYNETEFGSCSTFIPTSTLLPSRNSTWSKSRDPRHRSMALAFRLALSTKEKVKAGRDWKANRPATSD